MLLAKELVSCVAKYVFSRIARFPPHSLYVPTYLSTVQRATNCVYAILRVYFLLEGLSSLSLILLVKKCLGKEVSDIMARQGRLFSDYGIFLCKFRLFYLLETEKWIRKYSSSISETYERRKNRKGLIGDFFHSRNFRIFHFA